MNWNNIVLRLRNFDEWAEGDQWWKELYSSYKENIKKLCHQVADLLGMKIQDQLEIFDQDFADLFGQVFHEECKVHPLMQEELVVLLFKEEKQKQFVIRSLLF